MASVFRSFYLVRWKAAVLLCLPGILLAAWYAFGAFARFDLYRRAEKRDVTLTAELFQLSLFDVLRQDLRHVWLASPPEPSRIRRFMFRIDRPAWEALKSSRGSEERDYVTAQLLGRGQRTTVELRLLGQKPWHVLYKQRSLKVQLPRGELLDGYRVFTLTNDPSPMVVGEQIMLDLLRERGVLVPRSDFARVIINGSDFGVFRYETQPDESVLREADRQPGSMYSGDLPSSAGSHELWEGVARWRKVAWKSEDEREDMRELNRLLERLRAATVAEFAEFAEHELDLDAFARFEAIDIAFGCDQHNYRENHKLYFDPYKGRWEPIAWGFRGFEHDPVFNRTENPILLRLKQVPSYLAMRNRALYDLLTTDGSGSAVRERGMALFSRIGPELATDPFWDANRMLPRVDDFLRQMVRPMNLNRALLVFDSELETYERRRAFLIDVLRRNPLWLRSKPLTGGVAELDVVVDGEVGALLEGFVARWPNECAAPAWSIEDSDGVTLAVARVPDLAQLEQPRELHAATQLVAREGDSSARGAVLSRPAPLSYRFVLRSSCAPLEVEAVGLNLATGARIHSRPATDAAPVMQAEAKRELAPSDVPAFTPGERTPHPWTMPRPASERIELGPGPVVINETRVYESHQSVHVAAGTELQMGPGASLVFLGPVTFAGEAHAPIVVRAQESARRWGGLIVQGMATAGSRFAHLHASGGTTPSYRMTRYPGMINVHDTADVAFSGCAFSDNHLADDMVHVSYVEDLSVEDTLIERAASDAWDLEFATAVMRRVKVIGAGDDAIDLMGARAEVVDSVLIGLQGNGVSAGEKSNVSVQDTLIADARVGVLAKNASQIDLDGSLLYRVGTGARIYTRTIRYDGDSRISADVLFVVDSERAVKREDGNEDALDVGRAQLGLPRHDALDHLRDNVLHLDGWEGLSTWVDAQRAQSQAVAQTP